MAKSPGRLILVKIDTTGAGVFATIAGARTKSLTINSEQVDVTNSDSASQWRELLEGAGVKSMSVSCQGVFEDDAAFGKAIEYCLAGSIREYQFIYPGLGTFEGNFQVASTDLGGEYNAEANYSFSFESAGLIAFTAAP
jgi:TP901-1 family phage major tail protein